jgi:hypothetical protein
MINRSDQKPAAPEQRPAERLEPAQESSLTAGVGEAPSAPIPAGLPSPTPELRAGSDGGSRSRTVLPRLLRDRDESDPLRRAVELAQRGRMILDVSAADLEASEAAHGAFHPTTWHFRNAWNEARRSWERLRAELGTRTLEAALNQPPLVVLTLREGGDGADRSVARAVLIVIAGRTYCTQRVAGTELAPIQWRLTRPHPPLEDGPYYVCRLADRTTQCDCAEWTYQVAGNGDGRTIQCKHIAALAALGWI